MDVEEWKNREISIGFGDAPATRDIDAVRREVVVREHCALRGTRGPRRVNDDDRIIAVERRKVATRRVAGRGAGGECVDRPHRYVWIHGIGAERGDNRLRVRVGDDVTKLALAVENVDRHEDD